MLGDKFQSQSETIIGILVKNRGMSMEDAEKLWFNSKTYSEILRRNLTYIAATRALFELDKEIKRDSTWMEPPFDM